MLLYRAICHNESSIILQKLGTSWFHSKRTYPYGNKTLLPFYYLYVAEIDPKNINWEETVKRNKEWPQEQEVVIYEGSPVEVKAIFKYKKPCQTLLETINIKYTTTT